MFNFVEAYCLSGLAGLYKQSTNVVDIIITKCNNFNRLKGKRAEIVACFKKVNGFLFVKILKPKFSSGVSCICVIKKRCECNIKHSEGLKRLEKQYINPLCGLICSKSLSEAFTFLKFFVLFSNTEFSFHGRCYGKEDP